MKKTSATLVIFLALAIFTPSSKIWARNLSPVFGPFCALCGKTYSQKKLSQCPQDKFPLVQANPVDKAWILAQIQYIQKDPRRRFHQSRKLHRDFLKSRNSRAVEASLYAACERFAAVTYKKRPRLALGVLSAVIKREKKKQKKQPPSSSPSLSPFYKRAALEIFKVRQDQYQQAQTKREKEKYLSRLVIPVLYSVQAIKNTQGHKKFCLNLSHKLFKEGMELLEEGIKKGDFELRFRSEEKWKNARSVLRFYEGEKLYSFLKGALIYFELEALAHRGKEKLFRLRWSEMMKLLRRHNLPSTAKAKTRLYQFAKKLKEKVKKK